MKCKNRYGSLDFLRENTKNRILELLNKLDESDIFYNIYYGYPVIDECNNKEYVKGFIITKFSILIIYEYEAEMDVFSSCLINHISDDKSLIKIIRNFDEYIDFIDISSDYSEDIKTLNKKNEVFTEDDILKINRSIQKAYNLTSVDNREISNEDTLGSQLKKRNTFIGQYDSTQFNMVHSPITSHQRIRGLAGSGKTILMLKKLAFLHYNYPNLNLAFIFYTISLKSSLIKLFEGFYREYDRYNKPNMNKVNILHAWGGSVRGFYSDLCDKVNFSKKTYGESLQIPGNSDPFEKVCKELNDHIKNEPFPGLYDYIFIDEAQDFGINFFHLCLQALKNEKKEELLNIETGYLIYAYDELQSLKEEATIPSKVDIFKVEDKCLDINLKVSYRTTVEILTTAHALGLGVYRKVEDGEHPLVNYVAESNFIDMGYKNKYGDFSKGDLIGLYREEKKSGVSVPEPINFHSSVEQYKYLSNMIMDLVKNEDILPSDIMIIDLDDRTLKSNYKQLIDVFYKNIPENIDIRIRLMDKKTPNRTTVANEVLYTSVYRAKGNESNLVIIVNSNSIPLSSRNSLNRNKIFTAMTRAKWKVWLLGENMEDFKYEIKKIQEKEYCLEYVSPNDEELKKIKLLSAEEEKIDHTTANVEKLLSTLPEDVKRKLLLKYMNKE